MARTVPAAIDSTLDDRFIIPVFFLHFDFDTNPLYAHTDIGSITTLSQTWLGTLGIASISAVEENDDLSRAPGLKLRLSITDESAGSLFEELTQQDWYQREVIMYFTTRNTATGALNNDPFEISRWRLDVVDLQSGHGEAFVEAVCESVWVDQKSTNNDMYTDVTLQGEFSGDLGFQYMAEIVNQPVRWLFNDRVVVTPPRDDPGGREGEGDIYGF